MKIKTYDKRYSRCVAHSIKLRSQSHGENDIKLEISENENGFHIKISKPVKVLTQDEWININVIKNPMAGEYAVRTEGTDCYLTGNGTESVFRMGTMCRRDGFVVTVIPLNCDRNGNFIIECPCEEYDVANVDELVTKLADSKMVVVESFGDEIGPCTVLFSGGDVPPIKPMGSGFVHTMYHLNYVETGESVIVENEIYRWDKSEWVLNNTNF